MLIVYFTVITMYHNEIHLLIYSLKKIQLKIFHRKMERGIFDSSSTKNKYYGITQDPLTKDFIMIMDNYILKSDDFKCITDKLLHKSRNNVVDDFITDAQING